ncbi:uncharacterized protein LOC120442974 isoform X1 [Oreochromis aureus]|uniref:uncharacterized protein LOC120442974 isoform X1 n=1 Tax=Oreochromis aureus TaxID=47969 RepID=UPI001954E9C6|nr:uncharacterized protein LOC120442974 isoform X1 [Oreochromis aureus]
MDTQSKDGSRESYELKISELLKGFAEKKTSPNESKHTNPRNISLSITEPGTSYNHGTFRSRAVLPKKLCQLYTCQYERLDHLRESFSAPVLVLACIPASQAGQKQPMLSFSDPVLFAHLVEKSEILASDSVIRMREQLEKQEIYPYILGVQAWRKREQREPQCMLLKQFPQTGITNKWFFKDLLDLQRKLFLGASKKSGPQKKSQTPGKLHTTSQNVLL